MIYAVPLEELRPLVEERDRLKVAVWDLKTRAEKLESAALWLLAHIPKTQPDLPNPDAYIATLAEISAMLETF